MNMIPRLMRWLYYVRQPQLHRRRWQDRLLIGHITMGRVTLYGANAMHWALEVRIGRSYWCFHPITHTFGGYWPWYFYASHDATPQSAWVIRKGGWIE